MTALTLDTVKPLMGIVGLTSEEAHRPSDLKYVIVDRMGLDTAVIFAPWETHSDRVRPGEKVVSAGFFRIIPRMNSFNLSVTLDVYAYGDSESLGKVSREEDAEIISTALMGALA